eukprot:615455-Ditylum_brightwellii.AAC.1
MPFTNENRASVHRSLSIKDDSNQITECLTACGWIDGATDQLAALCCKSISDECLDSRAMKCKQSAAWTGVEQASDM